ncbi:hypothetical protein KP509_07G078700 [Ceratopteris richardii]|uniref:TORTIFOLIA1/SINE1-2 N-terminal domain-containing protein n=1 Tax=Ceratopteris richardii TaxID=49495 RepID=A0A8T2UGL6_CERRI|nr:hypothetical protein KP509_07G078700 [Ceratopteris richardii]
MALPSSARRRYPSPMIKQDLAKLGKDAESRRAALASLRSVVEEHVDSVSLPRFLQQVEDSREGRKHVGLILQDLARVHGPTLAPHIPRLLHLLVHNLLASTTCPVLLTACADAVVGVARHCSAGPNISPDDVLCQVSLPLLALLSNKIPPLSTGAATCLRVLVDSEQWRFAPPSLIENLCWKAAMAAAAPPTQTVAHINLLRSLAMSNASAISKFAPPLLRLSLDILLTPAATTSWQLRLAAVHLLESLLKAADYTTLVAHLQPSLAALSKCRRHDKLPQVRSAVLQALQTAEALQKEQSKQALDPKAKDPIDVDYHHHNDPFSSNTQVDLPSQISPSPLTSPTRLKSLSARIPTEDGPLDEIDYAIPYFCDTEETPEHHEITISNIVKQVSHPRILRSAVKASSCLINARKSSPNRQYRVPSLKLPTTQVEHVTIVDKEFVRRTIGADQSARRDMNFESNGQTGGCEVLPTPPSATRNITVLGSTLELLASCERHLVTGGKLKGQFAEAKYADDANAMIFPDAPITKNQAVNTDSKQANDLESTPSSHESEASVASVHLFNSLAHLAKVEKYQVRAPNVFPISFSVILNMTTRI